MEELNSLTAMGRRALIFFTVFMLASSVLGRAGERLLFDFVGGMKSAVRVTASDIYSEEKGYGYDLTDYAPVKGEGTKFFSVALKDGNYRVTVVVGSKVRRGNTTIKAEQRRLLLEDIDTKKGERRSFTFCINKRGPYVGDADMTKVEVRKNTLGLDWDGKLTLEFNGDAPAVMSVSIEPTEKCTTLWLCGNSTVVDQDFEPWASWGQMLPRWFGDGVSVANYAESGWSMTTLMHSRRLRQMMPRVRKGDYVFIEFGHNDQKEKQEGAGAYGNFTSQLRDLIGRVREKGAVPVLVTPTQRRSFDERGRIRETHGDYPDAMRKVGRDLDVPVIEVHDMTRIFFETLGTEGSKKALVHYAAGTFPGQTAALADNTHFNNYGAYEISKMVVEGMKRLRLPFMKHLAADWKPYDPARPDDFRTFSMRETPIYGLERPAGDQTIVWPNAAQEAKPYTRWWWMGSAVDEEGLRYCMSEFGKAGIGGVEITPIYGVQGNDGNEIPYLSAKWMEMLGKTEQLGRELGVEVEMATGTGWPFGGPNVPPEEAACRLEKNSDEGPVVDRTKQKVKRAAPGGEGYVIDHFDRKAVGHYLETFDRAFGESGVTYPHTFFNDSYEVYGADWTPRFLEEFKVRRGYDLKDCWKEFGSDRRIVSDYRETLGELLLENFTTQWTDWAHRHGAITRNQAHGSPANLIDIYAAVDIPECEGFGLSDFGIKGLRTDPGFTKKNDSDLSMLKYASSAAHISGKRLVSSETFTWLTEHFRTSLSQCKPDFDLMMVAGVNHVFFHGSCYSPRDAEWPGWRFYASVDMTPANNWWAAMPAFSKYIERVQSWMQYGKSDNDVLVYLPYYDMLYEQPGRLLQFDIHSMGEKAPKFISAINKIVSDGYDCDYISDKYIQQLSDEKGRLSIAGTRYDAIIIPDVRFMPLETLKKLVELARKGVRVIVNGTLPENVPGRGRKSQEGEFGRTVSELRHLLAKDIGTDPEMMRKEWGLSTIRRANEMGYHYFISNLQGKDVDCWTELARDGMGAFFFNPMDGSITKAALRRVGDRTSVHIQLRSGESVVLLLTKDKVDAEGMKDHRYYQQEPKDVKILKNWTLTFTKIDDEEVRTEPISMERPTDWTKLGYEDVMATGVYKTSFTLDEVQTTLLDLGDVRETARVTINGREVGTLFAVPYRYDITEYLRVGENSLEVEVCNLPANRIAKMDRQGKVWRKFKEINVVDLSYKKTTYENWKPMPSGLCSDVRLMISK